MAKGSYVVDSKILSVIAVAETGSFTKAAELLSLTQPAISQHIRLLEQELGVRIFERNRSDVKISPEGELVLNYSRRIVALLEALKQEVRDRKGRFTQMTVGITHTAEISSITEKLTEYAAAHEGTRIRLITDEVTRLVEMLRTFELDFIFSEGKVRDPMMKNVHLGTDSIVFVVPADHPLAKRKRISLSEIREQRLILRRSAVNSRNLFAKALEQNGQSILDFDVMMEMDNIAAIKELVAKGLGVTVLAKSACREELESGRLCALEIEDLELNREIYLVYPNDFTHKQLLEDMVQEYLLP